MIETQIDPGSNIVPVLILLAFTLAAFVLGALALDRISSGFLALIAVAGVFGTAGMGSWIGLATYDFAQPANTKELESSLATMGLSNEQVEKSLPSILDTENGDVVVLEDLVVLMNGKGYSYTLMPYEQAAHD